MAEAFGAGGPTMGFFAGTVVFLLGDQGISTMGYRDRKSIRGAVQSAAGLAIVLGIVLDGLPESAVIGLSLVEGAGVGWAVLVAGVPVEPSRVDRRDEQPAPERMEPDERLRVVGLTNTLAVAFAISWAF